jgi:O-antigen/teichoic acid export membrane protein
VATAQPLDASIWPAASEAPDPSAPGLGAGSLSGIAATAAGVLSAAITTPVLLHTMGASQFGVWVMLTSIAGYAQLADFGLGFSVGRFVGEYRAQRQVAALRSYFGSASLIYGGVFAAVFAVSAALGLLIPPLAGIPAGQRSVFLVSALVVGLATALAIGMALLLNILHAYQRLPLANGVRAAYWLLLAPASIDAALNGWGIAGLAAAMAGTTAIVGAVALVLTVRLVPDFRPTRPSARYVRQAMSYAGWMFAISLSATMAFETSNIIIAGSLGIGAVAAYAVALRLTRTLTQFVHKVSDVLFPFYAGMRAAADVPRMRANFLLTARLELVGGGAVVLFLAFAGVAALRLWVGQQNVLILSAFVLAIVLVVLDVVAYPAAVLTTATGGEKPAALINLVQAGATVAIALILVRPFGVAGVIGGAVLAQALTTFWWLPAWALRTIGLGWRSYLRRVITPVLLSLVPASVIGALVTLLLHAPFVAAAVALTTYGATYFKLGAYPGERAWLFAWYQRLPIHATAAGVWFAGLLGVAGGLRLINFFGPLDDGHEWRQTFTLMSARSYGHGAGWLAPYGTWFGVQPHPAGLEFPLYSIIAFLLSGLVDLVTAARIESLVCGVASIVVFYRICLLLKDPRAKPASVLFGFVPLAVFYSHATQPESLLLLLMLATAYAALRTPSVWWTLAGAVCFAAAAGIKPTAFVIMAFPLAYLFFKRPRRIAILVIGVAGAIGLLTWSAYTRWLLLQTAPQWYQFNVDFWSANPLKVPLDWHYYWTLANRAAFTLLPVPAIVFLIVAARRRLGHPFWWCWLAGSAAELLVFGSVNYVHIYYQLALVPALAALAVAGAPAWPRQRPLQVAAAAALIAATVYGMWPLYQQDPRYLDAGRAIAEAAAPGPPILVLSQLNAPVLPTVLYYADRPGWDLPLDATAVTIDALPGPPPCDLVMILDGPAPSQLPAGWIETRRTGEYVLGHRESGACPIKS